jgi:NADH dehydrogenase
MIADKLDLLILGGGFAGFYAARRLDRTLGKRPDVSITLVSRDGFLLFTPMLHEVATGDLAPDSITNPIRRVFRHVRFIKADVHEIDLDERRVHCRKLPFDEALDLEYDRLLIATGSETDFHGLPGVPTRALTLKSLGDALLLRSAMLEALEGASLEPDEARRRWLLTVVISGGGFSGVETTGAVNDFMRDAIRFYPGLDPREIRIVLVHDGDALLPELGRKLGEYAARKLAERGVEVILGARVTGDEASVLRTDTGLAIGTATLVWTAGVQPGEVIRAMRCEKWKGRILVDDNLEVPSHPGVWAVGDCAAVPAEAGGVFQPATAQHGLREGVHAARNIEATFAGRPQLPFRFKTLGQLASIGRRTGVANILGIQFSGLLAWFLWRTVYLAKLPTFRKKLRVAAAWTFDLLFSRDTEQLATVHDLTRGQELHLTRLKDLAREHAVA